MRGICKSQPASKYEDLVQPDLTSKDRRDALQIIYEERRPKRKREYKAAKKKTSKVGTKNTKGKGHSPAKTHAAKKAGAKQNRLSVVKKNENQVSVAEPPLHHEEGEPAEKSDQEHAEPAAEQPAPTRMRKETTLSTSDPPSSSLLPVIGPDTSGSRWCEDYKKRCRRKVFVRKLAAAEKDAQKDPPPSAPAAPAAKPASEREARKWLAELPTLASSIAAGKQPRRAEKFDLQHDHSAAEQHEVPSLPDPSSALRPERLPPPPVLEDDSGAEFFYLLSEPERQRQAHALLPEEEQNEAGTFRNSTKVEMARRSS